MNKNVIGFNDTVIIFPITFFMIKVSKAPKGFSYHKYMYLRAYSQYNILCVTGAKHPFDALIP